MKSTGNTFVLIFEGCFVEKYCDEIALSQFRKIQSEHFVENVLTITIERHTTLK